MNTSGSGSSVDVIIRQRYAWRRSYQLGLPYYPCNDLAIAARLNYSVTGSFNDMLNCVGGNSCSLFSNTSFRVRCADFSVAIDYQLCEGMFIRTLPINKTFVLNYYGNAWISLVMGGSGDWSVTSTINLNVRPDGKINSPPIAVVLPVVYRLFESTLYPSHSRCGSRLRRHSPLSMVIPKRNREFQWIRRVWVSMCSEFTPWLHTFPK